MTPAEPDWLAPAPVLPSGSLTPWASCRFLNGARSHGSHARCLRFAATVARAPRKTRFRLYRWPWPGGVSSAGIHREVSAAAQLMASSSLRLGLAHQGDEEKRNNPLSFSHPLLFKSSGRAHRAPRVLRAAPEARRPTRLERALGARSPGSEPSMALAPRYKHSGLKRLCPSESKT